MLLNQYRQFIFFFDFVLIRFGLVTESRPREILTEIAAQLAIFSNNASLFFRFPVIYPFYIHRRLS
jgi:hypothetical protein